MASSDPGGICEVCDYQYKGWAFLYINRELAKSEKELKCDECGGQLKLNKTA